MNKIFIKLGFNTLVQSIGRIASLGLGLVSIAVLTRYLGVTEYGNYALVFAYLSFFGIISDLGFNIAVINEANKKIINEKLLGTYFWIKLITSFLSFLIPVLLLVIFPYTDYQKTAIIIGAIAFGLGNLAGFGNTFLQLQARLDTITYIDVITKTATVALIVLFVSLKTNLFIILSSVILGNIVSLVLTFYAAKKHVEVSLSFDKKMAFDLFKLSIPIGVAAVFSSLYFKVDTLLLSIMKGPTEVGIYSLSYKIFENFLIFWGFYMAVFYPLLSKYYNSGEKTQYRKILARSFSLAIIFGTLIFLVGFFASGALTGILGGSSFVPSIVPLKILLLTGVFFFMNNIFYFYFIIKKRVNILLISLFLSLVVNLVLNFMLIPKYSYLGSSVATVATEIFLFLLYCIIGRDIFKSFQNLK